MTIPTTILTSVASLGSIPAPSSFAVRYLEWLLVRHRVDKPGTSRAYLQGVVLPGYDEQLRPGLTQTPSPPTLGAVQHCVKPAEGHIPL